MIGTKYFVLKPVDNNHWEVSWPGYENKVVDTPEKANHLLTILFDDFGLTEAQLTTVRHRTYFYTLSLSSMMWFQDPTTAARYTAEHTVLGCRFCTQELAERFLDVLEKLLVWNRLAQTYE